MTKQVQAPAMEFLTVTSTGTGGLKSWQNRKRRWHWHRHRYRWKIDESDIGGFGVCPTLLSGSEQQHSLPLSLVSSSEAWCFLFLWRYQRLVFFSIPGRKPLVLLRQNLPVRLWPFAAGFILLIKNCLTLFSKLPPVNFALPHVPI